MGDPDLRIHIHPPGEKTAELTCNWCGIVHPVEPEYKRSFLDRTEKQLQKLRAGGAELRIDSAEKAWTCGTCYLHINGCEAGSIRTECDHPVPDEPQTEELRNAFKSKPDAVQPASGAESGDRAGSSGGSGTEPEKGTGAVEQDDVLPETPDDA